MVPLRWLAYRADDFAKVLAALTPAACAAAAATAFITEGDPEEYPQKGSLV